MQTDPRFAPWREQALKRGYASSIALPLITEGTPLGAITIYSRQTGGFSDDELRLLQELANNLAYGVAALRLREAHAQAEEALRRKKEETQAELERLVVERTAKLQEMVAELEHFSYTITHDMRAPLRGMRGFAELMAEECGACERVDARNYLRRIAVSAQRMDALITGALSFSHAVRQELALTPVDVTALLQGMLESYPELQPSRARIRVEGQLPLVMGNEAGLTQCFSNLLGNAVKFVRPGELPQVIIRGERHDEWVRLYFEDKGIGIPKAMVPRVFDMFSRGHHTYEGTGIGLALVRKVMDRMGGRVGVESQEEEGSRFWLDLKPAETKSSVLRREEQRPSSKAG